MTDTTKKVLIYGSLTVALLGIILLVTAKPKPKPKPVEVDPEEECKKKGSDYHYSTKRKKCLKKAETQVGESSDATFCKKYQVKQDTFLIKDPSAFGSLLLGIQVKTPATEKLAKGTLISAKRSRKTDPLSKTTFMEICDETTGQSTNSGYISLSLLEIAN